MEETGRRRGEVRAAGQATAFHMGCRTIRNVSVTPSSPPLLYRLLHICNIVLSVHFIFTEQRLSHSSLWALIDMTAQVSCLLPPTLQYI
ncbi:unnamed protein product, partial [Brenthis ino]